MTDTILCSECPFARDWSAVGSREATVWWHKGSHDEKYVCKRCYMRLYMRERQGRRTREFE